MQPAGYSPYQKKGKIHSTRFDVSKPPFRFKKWLFIFFGALFFIFFIFYLLLGPFRFFANHYFGLAFFSKDYLIILQNDSELRPTGGFITGVGEIKMRFGVPSGIHFYNSYVIDTEEYFTPPEPHEEMLGGKWYQGYTFRDANWNPDFPSATTELLHFYNQKFPEKEVDGIVAINFSVMEDLVDAFGGIELEGQTVTSENLFSLVTHNVNNIDRHNEEALDGRKDILGMIFDQVKGQMIRHPFKAKRVMVEALKEKEMFMWFENERLQRKVVERNWGNTLSIPEGSDFLHVNVANLGSGKANRYLQTEVRHYMDLSSDQPEGMIELTFRYPGHSNSYFENYNAYIRLYLHPLAEVDTNFLESQVEKRDDFTIVSERISAEPGGTDRLTYTYTLPRDFLTDNIYRLYLAKQSGDEKWFNVLVEGPEGAQLISSNLDTRENRAYFQQRLIQDESIEVEIGPDTLSPYLTQQQFIDLNKIEIYWSEPVDEKTASDILNYSITDMDYTNGELTDEVEVIYAELVEDKRVEIEIEGASAQELERYTLTLKNIRDQSGNPVDPNPKLVTIVQRLDEEEENVEE